MYVNGYGGGTVMYLSTLPTYKYSVGYREDLKSSAGASYILYYYIAVGIIILYYYAFARV